MSEKTVRELEIELAEERGRRKALEEQLAAMRAAPLPQPQFIPMPYPVQPSVNPYPYVPNYPIVVTEAPKTLEVRICDVPPNRFSMLEITTNSSNYSSLNGTTTGSLAVLGETILTSPSSN